MAFCAKCGSKLEEGAVFCASCGERVETEPRTYAPAAPLNKGIAWLSYFGPFVFIPMFVDKDNEYSQYHVRQGVTLFAFNIGALIINLLLGLLKVETVIYSYGYAIPSFQMPWYATLISSLLSIFIAVLAIIGIVNAAKGNKKELPIIGKLDVMKLFGK